MNTCEKCGREGILGIDCEEIDEIYWYCKEHIQPILKEWGLKLINIKCVGGVPAEEKKG